MWLTTRSADARSLGGGMFGQPRFADMNAHINSLFERQQVLISAHRGSGGGSIAVNTTLGVKAAVLQGADIVEIDVTASRDGEFYCFHDGCEQELLGIEPNLQTLTRGGDRPAVLHLGRPPRPSGEGGAPAADAARLQGPGRAVQRRPVVVALAEPAEGAGRADHGPPDPDEVPRLGGGGARPAAPVPGEVPVRADLREPRGPGARAAGPAAEHGRRGADHQLPRPPVVLAGDRREVPSARASSCS